MEFHYHYASFFGTLTSDKNFGKLNGHQPLSRHEKPETCAVSLQIGKTLPNSAITESLLIIRNLVTIIPPELKSAGIPRSGDIVFFFLFLK